MSREGVQTTSEFRVLETKWNPPKPLNHSGTIAKLQLFLSRSFKKRIRRAYTNVKYQLARPDQSLSFPSCSRSPSLHTSEWRICQLLTLSRNSQEAQNGSPSRHLDLSDGLSSQSETCTQAFCTASNGFVVNRIPRLLQHHPPRALRIRIPRRYVRQEPALLDGP